VPLLNSALLGARVGKALTGDTTGAAAAELTAGAAAADDAALTAGLTEDAATSTIAMAGLVVAAPMAVTVTVVAAMVTVTAPPHWPCALLGMAAGTEASGTTVAVAMTTMGSGWVEWTPVSTGSAMTGLAMTAGAEATGAASLTTAIGAAEAAGVSTGAAETTATGAGEATGVSAGATGRTAEDAPALVAGAVTVVPSPIVELLTTKERFWHVAPHFWYKEIVPAPPQFSVWSPPHFMKQLPIRPGIGARSAGTELPQ